MAHQNPEQDEEIRFDSLRNLVQVRIAPSYWSGGVEMMIRSEVMAPGPRCYAYVKDLILEKISDPYMAATQPPTFRLDDLEAQQLIDDLWAAGLRPTQAKHTSETVSALRYHLEDMRRLVFVDNPAT